MPFRVAGKWKKKNDENLIQQYKESGDIDVLGILYNRYMVLVYGVCLKYLKDRERAKDAVMDIFEKLVVELQKRDVDNFKLWLYVVAKNHCLMSLRSKKLENLHEKKYQEETTLFMESESFVHPIDESDGNLNDTLKNCIDRLKKEQKYCIKLFYFDGKCYEEIAEELGVEINRVKSFIQNGKRNLKNCMEEANEQQG